MYSEASATKDATHAVRSYERAAASYERQIRIAEGRGNPEQARKLYDEYEEFLIAWRAQEELQSLFPGSAVPPQPHAVAPEEKRRIRALLEDVARFPAEIAEGRLAQACALYLIDHSEEALCLLDRLLGFSEHEARVQRHRGLCQIQLGRWREAYQTFSRALELEPAHPLSLAGKGRTLQKLGHPEEALVQYGRALELAPHVAETHFRIGECLLSLTRAGMACLAFDRAVALSPDCKLYRDKRARTLLNEGRLKAALQAYDGDHGSSGGGSLILETPESSHRAHPRSRASIAQSRGRRKRRRRRRMALLGMALVAGLFSGWAANNYVGFQNWSKRVDSQSAQRERDLRKESEALQPPRSVPYEAYRPSR